MKRSSIKIALMILALTLPTSISTATYRSDSDTGTEILDGIENARRKERAERLTGEQKNFLEELNTARARSNYSPDPDAPIPIAFEGDDLSYDEVTGDFVATGRVDVISLDGRKFKTDRLTGNTQDQTISVPGNAHIIQMVDGAPRITLDGFQANYSLKDKTGTLENAHGKVGEYYLTGKRFEFYPDRIIIHDGTQTKCGAKIPDYSLKAKRIEIINQETIRMYDVKFLIKNNVVGGRKFYERKVGESSEHDFPRIGYNDKHGVYIEQKFQQPIANHIDANLLFRAETKYGVRSNSDVSYQNRGLSVRGLYGFYSDDNYVWMQKEPGGIIEFSHKLGKLPLNYNLKYEAGHWRQESVASTHQYYEVGLTRDPILFHGWELHLHTSYGITKESLDNSTVNGLNYDAVVGKAFTDKFAAYSGYHYSKNTTKNSVFDFDLDDYSKKIDAGLSYKITDIDRVVFGLEYNVDNGEIGATDYFWYRDLHCSQLILRYRIKKDHDDRFEAHWNFLPW